MPLHSLEGKLSHGRDGAALPVTTRDMSPKVLVYNYLVVTPNLAGNQLHWLLGQWGCLHALLLNHMCVWNARDWFAVKLSIGWRLFSWRLRITHFSEVINVCVFQTWQ